MTDGHDHARQQIEELRALVGSDDIETDRRERMLTAIETFVPKPHQEPLYAQLAQFTQLEVSMLKLMVAAPNVKAHVLPPVERSRPAPPAAAPAPASEAPSATPSNGAPRSPAPPPPPAPSRSTLPSQRLSRRRSAPPPEPEPTVTPSRAPSSDRKEFSFGRRSRSGRGPNATKIYNEALKYWNEYLAAEGKPTRKDRANARRAAREVKEAVSKLARLPDGTEKLDALLSVVGVAEADIARGELEKRLR